MLDWPIAFVPDNGIEAVERICLSDKGISYVIRRLEVDVYLDDKITAKCRNKAYAILSRDCRILDRPPKSAYEENACCRYLLDNCVQTIKEMIAKRYPSLLRQDASTRRDAYLGELPALSRRPVTTRRREDSRPIPVQQWKEQVPVIDRSSINTSYEDGYGDVNALYNRALEERNLVGSTALAAAPGRSPIDFDDRRRDNHRRQDQWSEAERLPSILDDGDDDFYEMMLGDGAPQTSAGSLQADLDRKIKERESLDSSLGRR